MEQIKRTGSSIISVIILLTSCVAALAAQSHQTSLSGRVHDPSGAAIAYAAVELRHESLSFSRFLRTDENGGYQFPDLPPGRYILSSSKTGFESTSQPLEIFPDKAHRTDLTLEIAQIIEHVIVSSSSILGTPDVLPHIPGSVDVLTAADLEISRVFTVNEAMRKISGINARDEEGFGLRPNISIRGLNPTRSSKVLFLEDGIPLGFAPYGDNASYYHPPVNRFESIEFLKGSGQILYGPVTVGGVINYITPMPPRERSGSVLLTGGARNYMNGHIRYGGTWGRTGLIFDYMRKQGEGARRNTRSGLNDVNIKSVTTLTPRQSLTLKLNYYGENSLVTYSGLTESEYRTDPRQNPFRNDRFDSSRWGGSAGHMLALNS
ncbi:MAG TPA: TonB-dependent receptor plug domain-containing protein, partial [Acidobacteriota bacterium]|nr:TonB-dependent receptor plug domain-containing protein [Acidobacteriota bacterium]